MNLNRKAARGMTPLTPNTPEDLLEDIMGEYASLVISWAEGHISDNIYKVSRSKLLKALNQYYRDRFMEILPEKRHRDTPVVFEPNNAGVQPANKREQKMVLAGFNEAVNLITKALAKPNLNKESEDR